MEVAFKVVAIMQTITEELDEKGKRMLRKLFGISDETKSKNYTLGKKSQNEDGSNKD
jgi:hypothetical protein